MKGRPQIDGKTWLRYSISVWDDIKKSPEEKALKHPAMYPSALVERLLDCYLWHQGIVLDPFLGSGSTLVAALKKGHSGVGFEVVPEFCAIALERLVNNRTQKPLAFSDAEEGGFDIPKIEWVAERKPLVFPAGEQQFYIVQDSARFLSHYLAPRSVDILITSPPYWCVLQRKRTARRGRTPTYISPYEEDLSNIPGYKDFLAALGGIFADAFRILKGGAYCIVNVMDLRIGAQFIPYHMDITNTLTQVGFSLNDIIIWDRRREYHSNKPLGYPHKFVVNKVHEYLLVFRKPP